MSPGLADVRARLEAFERRCLERGLAAERRRAQGHVARWSGGSHGAARFADGLVDPAATAKFRDELGYWIAVARGQDPGFPGDFHGVFAGWQRTRLRELADQLQLDAAQFAAWAAARTVIEIGGGPHPAVAEARWRRAVAVDPLSDGYAAEKLFPDMTEQAGADMAGADTAGEDRAGQHAAGQRSPHAGRVIPLASTGEQIPLPGAVADLVIIENALDHVEDPLAVAREMARLLKPGGLVWLLVDLMEYRDHLHPSPMNEARLRDLMRTAGFEARYFASWEGASHPMASRQCRSLWRKQPGSVTA